MREQRFANRPFTVLSRARPRRIAFFVNPAECPPELLDSLFETNYSIWGGRYNPIIPVFSGVIADNYWNLFHFADPDVIYSYCDLSEDLVRHIDHEICPLEIRSHFRLHQREEHPNFYPSISHEQVNSSALLPLLIQREGRGLRKPKLFAATTEIDRQTHRLILRNFGVFNDRIALKPYPDDQEKMKIDPDWTHERFFEELANELNPIVFPFQASEAYAELPEPDYKYLREYCLVIGDDVQDWIYFWNRVFYLSTHRRSRWHTLCIPAASMRSQLFRDALRKFLRRFAYRSGNNPDNIDLVSSSVSNADLDKIKTDLFSGVDVIPRIEQIVPNDTLPISLQYRSYPEFYHAGSLIFERDRTTRQQATSNKCLLRAPNSKISLDRGLWMMDLRIEHVPEQPFYVNEKLWWMLPRDRELTNLFLPNRRSRVSEDHSISTEMDVAKVFELSIPSEPSVIVTALGIGGKLRWTGDIVLEMNLSRYRNITFSDKGDYINGVIGLLGGLQGAGAFLENSFWRFIVEALSRRCESTEEDTLTRIRNRLKKKAEILKNFSMGQEDALDWMTREVLKLARDQHMGDADISFAELEIRFHDQREAFIKKQPKFRMDSTKEGVDADLAQATLDLCRSLQSYVNDGVFRQGVRLRCSNCGSKYWQEISQVSQQNKCQGCGEVAFLSVKATWRYKLNTLVRNAVAFHGCIPVILTLYNLRHTPTKHTFIWATGLELFKKYADKAPSAELDLVCILDGKLIIGEVKTSCVEFNPKELTKLAAHAKLFDADVVVLACFRDQKNQIGQKRTELEGMLRGTPCQVWTIVPSSDVFEPTPHA